MREREKPSRLAGRRALPREVSARERRAVAAVGCLVATVTIWATLWWNAPVYPVTVEQAAGWHARSAAAAAAALEAPRAAHSVGLVVSRFSGNLSWVSALATLMHVTNITVYCKARRGTAACAERR